MFAFQQQSSASRDRRGFSSLEAIVAFTLLGSVLALSTPALVAHGRLLKSQRNYRLALDELANQLERASLLPAEELPAALEKLAPSPLAAERLPGATLRGTLAESQWGQRLTLEMWWNEPNRRAAPLRMTAWVVSPAARQNRNEE
jgi:hypothetical protein